MRENEYDLYEAERERWARGRHECRHCGEAVGDTYYDFFDHYRHDIYCDGCMKEQRFSPDNDEICADCNKPITTDWAYDIDGFVYCENCMRRYEQYED